MMDTDTDITDSQLSSDITGQMILTKTFTKVKIKTDF